MIMQVPITKSKGFVAINTDAIPPEVYAYALAEGLKVLANKGMTKITKETYTDEASLKTAAQAKGEANAAAILDGTIKIPSSAKTKKASGAVMTEARRLARNLVKDEMKRQGVKVSHVEASEITKAANELIDNQPEILAQAEANLAEREKVQIKIDVKAIPVSAKLVEAAEKRKAESKSQLSKTQAGIVAKPRAKPPANVTAH